MNNGKALLGLLAGIAVGATLGILFAPEKGTVTRKRVTKKGEDYVEGIENQFNHFIDGINQKYETLKSKAVHVVEEGEARMAKLDGELSKAIK
jgi:gas vesicle protein